MLAPPIPRPPWLPGSHHSLRELPSSRLRSPEGSDFENLLSIPQLSEQHTHLAVAPVSEEIGEKQAPGGEAYDDVRG